MNTHNLTSALKTVPESRLRLIELAWKVTGDDGSLDLEKLAFCAKEVEEAVAEAKACAQATREAIECLMAMVRSQP
jgi:hypothetical protein